MWMLRGASEENADFCLRLRPGRKYAVGRKDVDVNIKHSSVSRAHATLSVSTWSKTETPSTVTLDDTSAQGSFICQSSAASTDFVRVKSTLLKKGTLLKFAKCPQLFSLLYEPLTICPSSLSPLVLSELNALATANEILVSTDWSDDVGAIITKPSKITAKPILAMASALPIVTIDWIKAIDAAPDLSFAQPDTEPFLPPPITHATGNVSQDAWRIKPNRASLFKGIDFVTLGDDLDSIIALAIKLAGGVIYNFKPSSAPKEQDLVAFLDKLSNPCFLHIEGRWSSEILDTVMRNMGIQWSDAEDLPKCIIESSREVLNLAPSAIDESHAGPLATNSKDTTTKKIRGNSDDTMDHLSDDDSPAPSFKVRSRSVVEKAPVAVATETDKNENKEFEKASSCEKTGASRKASEKTKSNVFDPMELLFEEDAKPAKKLSVHGRTTTVSAKAPEASKSVSNTVKSKPKQKAEDLLDFLMDDDLDNSAATTKKSIPSSVTVAVQKESAPSRTLSKSMRNKNSSTADFFDSLLEDNDVQSQAPSVMDTNNTPMPHSQVAAVVKKEPPPIGTLKGETVSLAERLGMNSKKSRVSSKPPLAPPAPTLAAKTIEDNVCIVPATPPSLVKKDTKKADAPQAAQPDASDEDDFLPSRSRIPSSTTTSSKRPVEEVPEEPEPKKRKVAPTPGTAVKTQNLIDEAIQKTKHELEESEKESRRVLSKAVAAETKSLVKVVTFPIHRKSGLQQESRNNDEEERNTNGLVNQKRFKKGYILPSREREVISLVIHDAQRDSIVGGKGDGLKQTRLKANRRNRHWDMFSSSAEEDNE